MVQSVIMLQAPVELWVQGAIALNTYSDSFLTLFATEDVLFLMYLMISSGQIPQQWT
jgi:hypothetical protein